VIEHDYGTKNIGCSSFMTGVPEHQKQSIDTLINSVYVYDDRLVMICKNGTGTVSPDAVRQAFGSSSDAPLHKRNSNLIPVGNGFGFLYFFKTSKSA